MENEIDKSKILESAMWIAAEEGEKAGEAARQNDWSRVKFISDYFRRSKVYFSLDEQSLLQKAFDAGYKEGYGLPLGGYR